MSDKTTEWVLAVAFWSFIALVFAFFMYVYFRFRGEVKSAVRKRRAERPGEGRKGDAEAEREFIGTHMAELSAKRFPWLAMIGLLLVMAAIAAFFG